MKTIKCGLLMVGCLCLGQVCAQWNYQVRMAYYSPPDTQAVPSGFYERARANGFNYVLAEFHLHGSDWRGGRYTALPGTGLKERLKKEFIKADSYKLKLIPLFQTSNAHSGHWQAADNDKKIGWQELPKGVSSDQPMDKVVPTFAPDSQDVWGFDSTFKELLKVIYGAFNSAKNSLSYKTLDYIHFGADEPAVICTSGVKKRVVMARLCQNDRDWLKKNNYNNYKVQDQILLLLGSNIKRKVQMIKKVGADSGQTTTTALYYGDVLDPNQDGGDRADLYAFTDFLNPSPSGIEKITTYSLAASADVQDVKNSSIVVQWYYNKDYKGKDYDTDSTFRYFAHNGLKFLHGNAIANEGGSIANDRLYQLAEQMFVGSLPKYNNYARGFGSFHWNTKPYNPDERMYKTMEFLRHTMYINVAALE